MLTALDRGTQPDADRSRDALNAAQQANGDVTVSHATVVTDAAILVFREGLEAVLILAAITASFVGAAAPAAAGAAGRARRASARPRSRGRSCSC